MLTRIEIDGFKSLEDFALDLSPFTVILGANASGKSNLFDAIRFLSRLASLQDLRDAAHGLRGEPYELFRLTTPDVSSRSMRFAVEVLVDPMVRDPWGAEVVLKHTRIRYELDLERRPDDRGIDRLIVARERAVPISAGKDHWKPFGQSTPGTFRKAHLHYSSRRTPWLDTEDGDGQVSFKILSWIRKPDPSGARPESDLFS